MTAQVTAVRAEPAGFGVMRGAGQNAPAQNEPLPLDAVFPIASSFLQVFMRTAVTWVLTRMWAERGIYVGDTLAWFSAALFLMIVYIRRIDRLDPKKQTGGNANGPAAS